VRISLAGTRDSLSSVGLEDFPGPRRLACRVKCYLFKRDTIVVAGTMRCTWNIKNLMGSCSPSVGSEDLKRPIRRFSQPQTGSTAAALCQQEDRFDASEPVSRNVLSQPRSPPRLSPHVPVDDAEKRTPVCRNKPLHCHVAGYPSDTFDCRFLGLDFILPVCESLGPFGANKGCRDAPDQIFSRMSWQLAQGAFSPTVLGLPPPDLWSSIVQQHKAASTRRDRP